MLWMIYPETETMRCRHSMIAVNVFLRVAILCSTILPFVLVSGTAFAQQAFTSSNLPIIIINTNGLPISDDPKIMADMGIIYNGEGRRNSISDPFNEYNGKIGIEVRGQSSQMFPMKSYSIELWDEEGEGLDQSIFGMPEESDWVLYAPYTDKTLMRNFLAYTMSNSLGHWAAHCRYVEVVLNEQYVGIYVFMEKIKRDEGRVNVSKIKPSATLGDALTGGYIFSIDKEADAWFSSFGTTENPEALTQFAYVYPKLEDIVPEQQAYLKSYVDSFESVLHGPVFNDPYNGFRKFADEQSFIDFFIVNEISRNVDAYRLSTYLHKDRNSINNKIVCGPVWDYDLAFRNADYCNGWRFEGWAYQFNKVCPGDYWQVPFWWDRFMQDTAFTAALYCRWNEVRKAQLSNECIFHLVDSIAALADEAKERHFSQWPVLGEYVWPNPEPIPDSYAEEISTLKQWLTQRLSWIDDNLPQNGRCVPWPPDETRTFFVKTPNPVTSFYTFRIESKTAQRLHIDVIDMQGRIVSSVQLNVVAGSNSLPNAASLNGLQRGIYFFRLYNDAGEKLTVKLLRLY